MPVAPENEPEETSAAEEWRRFALAAGYLSAGGIQVAAGAWLGNFVGKRLDGWLGTGGVFAVALAFAGFAGGLYQMWRTIQLLQRRQSNSNG